MTTAIVTVPPVLAAPGQPACHEAHPFEHAPCGRPKGHAGGHRNEPRDLYWPAAS